MCSDYVKSLPPDVRKRYNDKTSVIGCDPYNIAATCLENDVTKWPPVGFWDVVNYLIFSRSSYTSEQLKKYKSLESYKYCQGGWIRQILHKEINGVHLIRSVLVLVVSRTRQGSVNSLVCVYCGFNVIILFQSFSEHLHQADSVVLLRLKLRGDRH